MYPILGVKVKIWLLPELTIIAPDGVMLPLAPDEELIFIIEVPSEFS
jgi:hypothetical protein